MVAIAHRVGFLSSRSGIRACCHCGWSGPWRNDKDPETEQDGADHLRETESFGVRLMRQSIEDNERGRGSAMTPLWCETHGKQVHQHFVAAVCPNDAGCRTRNAETTLTHMAITDADRKALNTAGRKVTEWTQKRDQLIRAAVASGGSLREVGAAVGLSHMAVKFIAHGRGEK